MLDVDDNQVVEITQIYQYVGCLTAFSENGTTQVLTANSEVQLAEDEYSGRLIQRKLLLSDDNGDNGNGSDEFACVPQASEWSNPITWEMVNYPNSNGWLGILLDASGSPNFAVRLTNINNIEQFMYALTKQIREIEYKIVNGSAIIRYKPYGMQPSHDRPIPEVFTFSKRGKFFVYDKTNIGSNAETTICLADAFADVPKTVTCSNEHEIIPM